MLQKLDSWMLMQLNLPSAPGTGLPPWLLSVGMGSSDRLVELARFPQAACLANQKGHLEAD